MISQIITVGLWTLGAICTLIVVAVRLSWQASKLHSGVTGLQGEAKELRLEISHSREDMKSEVGLIHRRIDDHEKRICIVEASQ